MKLIHGPLQSLSDQQQDDQKRTFTEGSQKYSSRQKLGFAGSSSTRSPQKETITGFDG
jgi:hypothetical protein